MKIDKEADNYTLQMTPEYARIHPVFALSLRQPSYHQAYQRIPPLGGSLTVTLHPEDTIVVPRVD